MLGKITEFHRNDAFYPDSESFIGSIWDFSDLQEWGAENAPTGDVVGYYWGCPVYMGESTLHITSNGEHATYVHGETSCFHAVKFEILENTGE